MLLQVLEGVGLGGFLIVLSRRTYVLEVAGGAESGWEEKAVGKRVKGGRGRKKKRRGKKLKV